MLGIKCKRHVVFLCLIWSETRLLGQISSLASLSIRNSLLISLIRDDNRRLRDVSGVRVSSVSGSALIKEVDGVSIPSMSLLSPVGIEDYVEKKWV